MTLSLLEQEALDALKLAKERFSAGRINNEDFMDVMHTLRKLVFKMDNIRSGCPSGKHACSCTCKPGIPGYSTDGSGKAYVPRKAA